MNMALGSAPPMEHATWFATSTDPAVNQSTTPATADMPKPNDGDVRCGRVGAATSTPSAGDAERQPQARANTARRRSASSSASAAAVAAAAQSAAAEARVADGRPWWERAHTGGTFQRRQHRYSYGGAPPAHRARPRSAVGQSNTATPVTAPTRATSASPCQPDPVDVDDGYPTSAVGSPARVAARAQGSLAGDSKTAAGVTERLVGIRWIKEQRLVIQKQQQSALAASARRAPGGSVPDEQARFGGHMDTDLLREECSFIFEDHGGYHNVSRILGVDSDDELGVHPGKP